MLTPMNQTYKASDNYIRDLDKRAMKLGAYTALAKITIVGTDIVFTEDNNLSNWTYEDYKYVPDIGFLGQFVEKLLDVELTNTDSAILENKEINLQIGIVNGLDNNTTTYYNFGNFLITDVDNDDTSGMIKLELSDYTKKFNQTYSDKMYYPCTALELANNVCSQAGVTFHSYADAYVYIVSDDVLDIGNYFIRVDDNNTEKYVKIALNDKLNKLDSIMLVYDPTNGPFAIIKQIFPNGHIVRNEIEIQSSDITDDISQVSGYTELVCKSCGYQPFANNDFIIENNQIEADETLRDVMKAIGALGYSWVRIGRDNECYIDFTVKSEDDVDEYNVLTTDEYYTSTKQDLYFGPVNRIELGMEGIEGETFYNERNNKSVTGLVLKGKSIQDVEQGVVITPDTKVPINSEPGIENLFDKNRLQYIKQEENMATITFTNDGIELYIHEDDEYINGFILPESNLLLGNEVYIGWNEPEGNTAIVIRHVDSTTGEIDRESSPIYVSAPQVVEFPDSHPTGYDSFAILFSSYEIEKTIAVKDIMVAKTHSQSKYIPSGHKYVNIYNNSRNLFDANSLTFYPVYDDAGVLPVVDSNNVIMNVDPGYASGECNLYSGAYLPAGTYYMEMKAFTDNEGSQVSDVAGMQVWDSSHQTCYGSMMFDTDELDGEIIKRVLFTIPDSGSDEPDWYDFDFILDTSSDIRRVTFSDILLTKDDISYEPFEYKSTLYNIDGITLDGIDNHYDEYDVINGHVTKRIGTYIIDNTAEKVDTYTNVAFVKIPKTEDNVTYNTSTKQKILCDCALYNSSDIADDTSLTYDILEDNLYYYICCYPEDLDNTYDLCQGGVIKYVLSTEGVYDRYTDDSGSPAFLNGYNDFHISNYSDSCNVVVTDLDHNQTTYTYRDEALYSGNNKTYIVVTNVEDTVIQILNNPFTYTEELRKLALRDSDVLYGLKYMPSEINSIGHIWLQGDDLIELTNTTEQTYVMYPFNQTISYAGYIKTDFSSIGETKVEADYEYGNDVNAKMNRIRIIVDKANKTITQLLEETADNTQRINETISTLEGTTQTISQLETDNDNIHGELSRIESRIDGMSVDTSIIGGNNLIKNSVGYFGSDFWQVDEDTEGNVKTINDADVKNNSISGSGLLLQNESIYQRISGIKKGDYRIGFSYKMLKPLSTCSLSINDMTFSLNDPDGWVDISEAFTSESNNLLITISSNMDDSCIITDLMLSSGNSEVSWEQNSNETFTDTVKIGKGIVISSTGSDTALEATASGIDIKNTSTGDTTSRFDKYGTTTDDLTVNKSIDLAEALIVKKVGDQVWFININ